jgi:serine/threonine protein kinase
MALEVVQMKQYSYEVDWWALGVVAFELIFGESPFYDSNREKMLSRIVNTRPNFPRESDAGAIDFVQKLLIKDPKQRFSFDRLKSHKFFSGLSLQDVLEKKVTPSFVPELNDLTCPKYFDKEFTCEPAVDSLGSVADHEDVFNGFDFMNDVEY